MASLLPAGEIDSPSTMDWFHHFGFTLSKSCLIYFSLEGRFYVFHCVLQSRGVPG